MGSRHVILLTFSIWFLACTSPLQAHPVPKNDHDRVVTVRLSAAAVVVTYHLEVDPFTVVYKELPDIDDKLDFARLKPKEIYELFGKLLEPYLLNNLDLRLDGKELKLSSIDRQVRSVDSIQCDYTFRATWQLTPGKRHRVNFHEGTYLSPDHGQIAEIGRAHV